MPLESASVISELDKTWPLGGDELSFGNDHLQLIKSVLQSQFPGVLGDGFSIPITATEAEINYLAGVTSNIQNQINQLNAPAGTVLAFHQAAPPLGWTQILTYENSMLRVVDIVGGGNGGTDDPIEPDFSHVHTTSAHAITISEMPSHNHEQNGRNVIGAEGGDGGNNWVFGDNNLGGGTTPGSSTPSGYYTLDEGADGAHEHGDTGNGDLSFRPRYVDMILASKDL